MNALRLAVTLTVLTTSSAAWAASAADEALALCHDTTGQDRQPDFSADAGFTNTAVIVTSDSPPKLRLNTNLTVLDTESIIFPFPQEVSVSFVFESAGHAHALGYLYYDDLISRGYVNTQGTATTSDDVLYDTDGNGISDFYDDIFNMSQTRPYVGISRRCTNTFNSVNGAGVTKTYYEPELAMGACGATFEQRAVTHASALRDARPGLSANKIASGIVGKQPSANITGEQWQDRGLWPTVPNLLEPRHTLNANKGLGHIVFLQTEDDSDTGRFYEMAPVADSASAGSNDGIPDYNVSGYDPDGRPLDPAPDNVINTADRTVNLGVIEGNKEVVFFMITWGNNSHNPSATNPTVWPCLRYASVGGACNLHLQAPVNIFFSKTALNIDQNPQTTVPTARADIGCNYGSTCTQTGTSLPGWLDSATITRLNTAAYSNLVMPHEIGVVPRSASNMTPHTFLGAPSTDPYRWILGFEDLAGGGDHDYNDVSFMINKSNGGTIRSAVVSGDLSPSIAQDFTITEVTFSVSDQPYYTSAGGTACTAPAVDPRIDYQVALDCKVCTANCSTTTPTWTEKADPTWVTVPIAAPAENTARSNVSVNMRDFLEKGYTGSQLCWRAVMTSPNELCQPTISNINISYKAQKAGDYSRASTSTMANALIYGVHETPGKTWFNTSSPAPSVRVFDGRADVSERGHLYFTTLYNPETPATTNIVKRWDSGAVLAADVAASDPSTWRKLYTMKPDGTRGELSALLTDAAGGEAFNTTGTNFCALANGGTFNCDLDKSGGTPDADDRALLRNWLYGWENKKSTPKVPRTWPMGGINLSTAAITGPAGVPPWLQAVGGNESAKYRLNFQEKAAVKNRTTVAFVGATNGYLHAFAAGEYRPTDDTCTDAPLVEHRGYFKSVTGCSSTRDYGTGKEIFAYLPRKMLPYYVHSYRRSGTGKRPSVDASPTMSDVDLGFGTYDPKAPFTSTEPAWTIRPDASSTTLPTQGAKTVLVSPTGPDQSVIFSLDVTDPTRADYPTPMWEIDLAKDTFAPLSGSGPNVTIDDMFASLPLKADTKGSRHHPPVIRMDFGESGTKWVAAIATDYTPNTGAAGTVYLLDMKTGKPVQVQGTGKATMAGIITLGTATDGSPLTTSSTTALGANEGVGGEPAVVDVDQNGSYDVMYVPSTSGKVYRVNLTDVNLSRPLGQIIRSCVVASAPVTLAAKGVSNPSWHGIYSNISVKRETSTTGTTVKIFLGTANHPEISTEPADLASPKPNYYVMGFEDTSPLGSDCAANYLWHQALGEGQAVWGGVAQAHDSVFTTTAVGTSADSCNLDANTSGKFFAFSQPTGNALTGSGTKLDGHGLNTPVVHDDHLFMLTADGRMVVRGQANTWNNAPTSLGSGPSRVLLWDVQSKGKLK